MEHRHLLIGGLLLVAATLCTAGNELDDLPRMMVKEIKCMARNSRSPSVIIEMLKKCGNITEDEKRNVLTEWSGCIGPSYSKKFTEGLEGLNNACTAFSDTTNCYWSVKKAVNTCYGEGTDLFQFTSALFNYICTNKQETIDQIQNQKFIAFESEAGAYTDLCLVNQFHNQPFARNQTCKSLKVVDLCFNKYNLTINSTTERPGNYFGYMMKSLDQELKCGSEVPQTTPNAKDSTTQPPEETTVQNTGTDTTTSTAVSNSMFGCNAFILWTIARLALFSQF